MEELTVRRPDSRDLPSILSIERLSVGAPHWSEAVWGEVLSADASLRTVFVGEIDGVVVGFVVVGRAAEVAEIESVAVASQVRRQGVARTLCRHAMRWARETGLEAMELEVRASNVGAIALYSSLEFVEQGRRRAYYHEPVEDAVLMGIVL